MSWHTIVMKNYVSLKKTENRTENRGLKKTETKNQADLKKTVEKTKNRNRHKNRNRPNTSLWWGLSAVTGPGAGGAYNIGVWDRGAGGRARDVYRIRGRLLPPLDMFWNLSCKMLYSGVCVLWVTI